MRPSEYKWITDIDELVEMFANYNGLLEERKTCL